MVKNAKKLINDDNLIVITHIILCQPFVLYIVCFPTLFVEYDKEIPKINFSSINPKAFYRFWGFSVRSSNPPSFSQTPANRL